MLACEKNRWKVSMKRIERRSKRISHRWLFASIDSLGRIGCLLTSAASTSCPAAAPYASGPASNPVGASRSRLQVSLSVEHADSSAYFCAFKDLMLAKEHQRWINCWYWTCSNAIRLRRKMSERKGLNHNTEPNPTHQETRPSSGWTTLRVPHHRVPDFSLEFLKELRSPEKREIPRHPKPSLSPLPCRNPVKQQLRLIADLWRKGGPRDLGGWLWSHSSTW